ncbi:MAG: hypothetical protein R3B53_03735 [Candidatus Paceibacterota bacterium]
MMILGGQPTDIPLSQSMASPVVQVEKSAGPTLIHLSQRHIGIEPRDEEELKLTLLSQKGVAEQILALKAKGARLSVCTEGVIDVNEWLKELAVEMEDNATFQEEVRHSLRHGDMVAASASLAAWVKYHEDTYTPGYAQARNLYAIAIAMEEYLALGKELPEDLAQAGGYGRDLLYYGGALKQLVVEGKVQPNELVACEDSETYLAVGHELTGGTFDQLNYQADEAKLLALQSAREDKILAKLLAMQGTGRQLVVVMGDTHDFTEKVLAYNQRHGTDFRYLKVPLPK